MEMPHEFSSYYELHYQNKELFVYTNSLERIVDVDSGKIIKTEFVK